MATSRSAWLAAGLAAFVFDARGARAESVFTPVEGLPAQACVQSAPAPIGSAGMVIYRNPVTGAFEAPPPDVAAQMPAPAAQRPPVERMGVTAGGGVLLDHIPMMDMTATVDTTGRVSTRCDHQPAHSERE